jgi:hypothetical protein
LTGPGKHVNIATVARDSGMLKLTGASEGTGILKLYRDTDNRFDGAVHGNTKELFMELDIRVTRASRPAPSTPKRVEAPVISYEVDANNNIISWSWEGNGCPAFYNNNTKILVNPLNDPWEKARIEREKIKREKKLAKQERKRLKKEAKKRKKEELQIEKETKVEIVN